VLSHGRQRPALLDARRRGTLAHARVEPLRPRVPRAWAGQRACARCADRCGAICDRQQRARSRAACRGRARLRGALGRSLGRGGRAQQLAGRCDPAAAGAAADRPVHRTRRRALRRAGRRGVDARLARALRRHAVRYLWFRAVAARGPSPAGRRLRRRPRRRLADRARQWSHRPAHRPPARDADAPARRLRADGVPPRAGELPAAALARVFGHHLARRRTATRAGRTCRGWPGAPVLGGGRRRPGSPARRSGWRQPPAPAVCTVGAGRCALCLCPGLAGCAPRRGAHAGPSRRTGVRAARGGRRRTRHRARCGVSAGRRCDRGAVCAPPRRSAALPGGCGRGRRAAAAVAEYAGPPW
jgi:hypothetical protein